MMPKLWASHTGLVWLSLFVLTAMVVGAAAQGQQQPEGEPEEYVFGGELLNLRNFRATATFVDDDEEVDTPVVVLTWESPPLLPDTGVFQLILYRSTNQFPTGPLDGNLIPLAPEAEAYLDTEVLAGQTYYYTLIADLLVSLDTLPPTMIGDYPVELLEEFPQVRYARVTAGASVPNILTESLGQDPLLGPQKPFDLFNTQITIRPVGPPLAALGEPVKYATYDSYEAIVTHDVSKLPVKAVDDQGGAYTLTPLRADRLVELSLGDMRFPFFGKEYDRIYLAARGYIVFEDMLSGLDDETAASLNVLLDLFDEPYDVVDLLNAPNLLGHFMVPRISFLYSMFDFQLGGEAWARMLPDRAVITFERATEQFYHPFIDPARNTVQVELFFSGKIRITYLEAFVRFGIVGLSDGRGVPVDPTEVFDNLEPVYRLSDFTFLPQTPSRLSVNPVTPPVVRFGNNAAFIADAVGPPGMNLPFFTGSWTNPGIIPFTDIGGGAGEFFWRTTRDDLGEHTVRINAEADGMRAYQDVRVIVRETMVKPSARNLLLSTGTSADDPSVSRAIPAERPLIASYVYEHPYKDQAPWMYGEHISFVYWFRNDQLVPTFTNSMRVPPHVPQPGDKWRFQVIPITVMGDIGSPANSPIVTVVAAPQIDAVLPGRGLTIGGETVTIRGTNLGNPLSVVFGDARAGSVRVIDSTEIRVVTPPHPAGSVTITIETIGGIGRRIDAFDFVGDEADETPPDDEEDKRLAILGCGGNAQPATGHAGSLLLAGFVALALSVSARRRVV